MQLFFRKIFIWVLLLLFLSNCTQNHKKEKTNDPSSTPENSKSEQQEAKVVVQELSEFIPENYVPFDTIYGDLNKDGSEDCVLIIKGTKKELFVEDEYRGKLDRNRRGVIILLSKKDRYEQLLINKECFSSECEDGGVYFPPELNVQIKKGNLFFHYAHGRYGYWRYNFRYRDGNFELIGYDCSSNRGPITIEFTSINFLTKKKQVKENINIESYDGDWEDYEEEFKETWETINLKKYYKLSEIKDFDELSFEDLDQTK